LYSIITENDQSQWADQTGVLYHFPKRYKKYLSSGTKVIYYKGRLKNRAYREKRLSDDPHYFAVAEIGEVFPDKESTKSDLFATIVNYSPFKKPVLAKEGNEYLEEIPENRISNYWRDGVRKIEPSVYNRILSKLTRSEIIQRPSSPIVDGSKLNDCSNTLESGREGSARVSYVTTYERSPVYRAQAIAIHGVNCKACGFNFESFYGEYAKDYIHIHHLQPVSELDAPQAINPLEDLVPLCANCHSIVHRRKGNTLSLDELIKMIEEAKEARDKG